MYTHTAGSHGVVRNRRSYIKNTTRSCEKVVIAQWVERVFPDLRAVGSSLFMNLLIKHMDNTDHSKFIIAVYTLESCVCTKFSTHGLLLQL